MTFALNQTDEKQDLGSTAQAQHSTAFIAEELKAMSQQNLSICIQTQHTLNGNPLKRCGNVH